MLHHETCGHISSTSRLNRLCSQETVGPKRLHSRSKRQAQTVCKARGAQLAETKRKIVQLAGMKNGLDRSAPQKKEIESLIKEMEGSQPEVKKANLQDSQWRLAYSTSTGSSGGKIGPFIGWVEQEFPADKPGQYINKVDFGLLSADLLAEYEYAANNKINVKFVDTTFFLGPFKFRREFSNQGFWDIAYVDDDFRILYTNLGNVFVMERIEQSKIRA